MDTLSDPLSSTSIKSMYVLKCRRPFFVNSCTNPFLASMTPMDVFVFHLASHIYVSRNPCEKGSRLMACGVDFKLDKITNNVCTAKIKNQVINLTANASFILYLGELVAAKIISNPAIFPPRYLPAACRSTFRATI